MSRALFRAGFRGAAVLWAAVVTLGLFFSGCEQPGGGSRPSYITFDSRGGSGAAAAREALEGVVRGILQKLKDLIMDIKTPEILINNPALKGRGMLFS
jgi:hypothetical protein